MVILIYRSSLKACSNHSIEFIWVKAMNLKILIKELSFHDDNYIRRKQIYQSRMDITDMPKLKLKTKMTLTLMLLAIVPALLTAVATGWVMTGSLTAHVVTYSLTVTAGFGVVAYFACVKLVEYVLEPINYTTGSMEWIAKDIVAGKCDLTQPLEGGSNPFGQRLAKGTNQITDAFASLIREVSESSSKVAEDSEKMATITEQSMEGIMRQRNETEMVATAMNEMTASVHEVSRNAASGASVAQATAVKSQEGSQVVQNTISGINTLADNVSRASDVIHALEKDSDSIGSVLDVIQGIAEQTNLLALNAAIEAARAGEQGRGFAVVADEVRSLASRTQDSTQEIQAIIEKLQARSKQAVTVMDEGQKQAQVSVELAQAAGEALSEISSGIEELDRVSTQIAVAAEEQGTVAEEINRNVVNINDVSVQNADAANLSSSTSQDLSSQASLVSAAIGSFKV